MALVLKIHFPAPKTMDTKKSFSIGGVEACAVARALGNRQLQKHPVIHFPSQGRDSGRLLADGPPDGRCPAFPGTAQPDFHCFLSRALFRAS